MTTDKGWQDHCYLTAEEHSEEQTGKPKSKKRKRKKTSNLLPSIMTQEPFLHSREGELPAFQPYPQMIPGQID